MFDVDAYDAAHRPWSFVVGGRTFGAKHVSANAVMRYEHRVHDTVALLQHDRRRGARAQLLALKWLLRYAFPWRFSYLVHGDPVTMLLSMRPSARAEALKDFFAYLQGVETPPTVPLPPPSQIPGTNSLAPTPPRSP